MSVKILCNICLDVYPLSGMLFQQCGHGMCLECTGNVKEHKCPTCRESYDPHAARQIFAEFGEDTPSGRVRRLTGCLKDINNVDVNSPEFLLPGSGPNLGLLSKKLRDVEHQNGVGLSEDDLKALLDAAKSIDTVVAPLRDKLTELKGVNKRNSKLRQENEELRRQLLALTQSLDDRDTELHTLQRRLKVSQKETRSVQEQLTDLSQRYESQTSFLANLQEENAELKAARHDEKAKMEREIRLGKSKLNAMTKEKKKLQKQLSTLIPASAEEDESLIVG